MKRLTYIYLLAPLYTVLSFMRDMENGILGAYGTLAVGSVLCIAIWAIVWIRIYGGNGRLRPEFAILSVLPAFCYLGLKAGGDEVAAAFSAPVFQNLYFLTWLAGALILILTMFRNPQDGPARKWKQDATLHLMTIFILLYTFFCWAGTAADLFHP